MSAKPRVHLYVGNGEVACHTKKWELCLPHLETVDGKVNCPHCLATVSEPVSA